MRARELTKYECQACDEGWTDRTIGGDGYGNRCAGLMDVPARCYQCGGTGIEEAIYRKARLYPLEGGDGEWTIEHDEALYPTLEDACTAIDDELDYPPPPKGMSADEARATW